MEDEIEEKNCLQDQERLEANELRKRYLKLCERLNVPQISVFAENIASDDLIMRHRGVGSKAMKAIAISLKKNKNVRNVDLTDNNLNDDAAKWLSKMFETNYHICSLTLSNNRLTHEGLQLLLQTLESNRSILYLDLSDNAFTDRCGEALKDFLLYNETVREFNFSKNKLCSSSGSQLREGIEYNSAVETLNLSWNNIRCEGAEEIAKSLIKNSCLKKVVLSWNGFADNCCESLAKALTVNDTLEELDLSKNRISDKGATELAKGLIVNQTLRTLRLGWNSLKTSGVNAILNALLQNKQSSLEGLHFEEIYVSFNNRSNMDSLVSNMPSLKITIGGFTTTDDNKDIDEESMRRDLLNILKAYLVKNRLRMVDLFNQWDKDKSFSITRKEFRNGVRSCKIPFSESQMKYLIEWLDNDGSDEIEYQEFVGITEIE